MAESPPDFRDTLLELIDTSPAPVDHPSPDQWIAYHRGELSAADEARLQEHLVRCRDCFDLAAGAASFAEPDEKPDASQDMENAALWRLLRPQLEEQPPDNVREISAGPRRQPSSRFRLPNTLAALFFVALVGMTAWILSLRSERDALRAPQPNAVMVDIPSAERDLNEMALPAGPQMLVLHPVERLQDYRLVIRDAAAGTEVSSYGGLKLDQDFSLTLYLPVGLHPGRYRMELVDGGSGRVLQTRALRVGL